MAKLETLVEKVRSKNAGPFWVTLDIFCGSHDRFQHVAAELDTASVAALLRADPTTIRRFEVPELSVVKFSLPRPVIQGHREDRDMHGASWAVLLAELEIEPPP